MLGVTVPSRAAMMRVCDGRPRHVECHFSGGGHLVADVPPDEVLTYGPPTLSFSDRGRLHIVLQACEIVCDPARPSK